MGVIHGDMKCDNVLVSNDITLVISDFGCAAVVPDSSEPVISCECSTPSYLSKEANSLIKAYGKNIPNIYENIQVLYHNDAYAMCACLFAKATSNDIIIRHTDSDTLRDLINATPYSSDIKELFINVFIRKEVNSNAIDNTSIYTIGDKIHTLKKKLRRQIYEQQLPSDEAFTKFLYDLMSMSII